MGGLPSASPEPLGGATLIASEAFQEISQTKQSSSQLVPTLSPSVWYSRQWNVFHYEIGILESSTPACLHRIDIYTIMNNTLYGT